MPGRVTVYKPPRAREIVPLGKVLAPVVGKAPVAKIPAGAMELALGKLELQGHSHAGAAQAAKAPVKLDPLSQARLELVRDLRHSIDDGARSRGMTAELVAQQLCYALNGGELNFGSMFGDCLRVALQLHTVGWRALGAIAELAGNPLTRLVLPYGAPQDIDHGWDPINRCCLPLREISVDGSGTKPLDLSCMQRAPYWGRRSKPKIEIRIGYRPAEYRVPLGAVVTAIRPPHARSGKVWPKSKVQRVDAGGSPTGKPETLAGVIHRRKATDFGWWKWNFESSNRAAQKASRANRNGIVPFRDKPDELIYCRHLALQWVRDRTAYRARKPAAPERFAYAGFKDDKSLAKHMELELDAEFDKLVPEAGKDTFPPDNLGGMLALAAEGVAEGQARHLMFYTPNHVCVFEVQRKPGGHDGPPYAIAFYDPNETGSHKRVLCNDLSEIRRLRLRDWLGEKAIVGYLGSDPRAQCCRLFDPASGPIAVPPALAHSPDVAGHPQMLLNRHGWTFVSNAVLAVAHGDSARLRATLQESLAAPLDLHNLPCSLESRDEGRTTFAAATALGSSDAVNTFIDMVADSNNAKTDKYRLLAMQNESTVRLCRKLADIEPAIASKQQNACCAWAAKLAGLIAGGTLQADAEQSWLSASAGFVEQGLAAHAGAFLAGIASSDASDEAVVAFLQRALGEQPLSDFVARLQAGSAGERLWAGRITDALLKRAAESVYFLDSLPHRDGAQLRLLALKTFKPGPAQLARGTPQDQLLGKPPQG